MSKELHKDTLKVSDNQIVSSKNNEKKANEVSAIEKLLEVIKEKEFDNDAIHSLIASIQKKPTMTIAKNYLFGKYDFKYNEIANRFEGKIKQAKEYLEVNENNLFVELQEKKISLSQAGLKALMKSDYVPKYNIFKEYFEELPTWKEGKDKDYILALANYTSVIPEDRERFNYHFKKHLVRSVACDLGKYVNKQCFVFSGGQNNGKSTFIRFLLPQKLQGYIAENIGTDKDSLIALTENFIINLDELSTLNKAEIDALKAVFSKDVVKVRKPFEPKPLPARRVANLWATTNRREVLSDETGSVRWLIFETKGTFNFNYSKEIDMNKVYAQAYALLQSGFEYELNIKDVSDNDKMNKKYQIQTPEMEGISYLYASISREEYDANKDNESEYFAKTSTDIKQNLEDVYKQRFNTNNIGKALRFLGFEQISMKRGKGYPIKVWILKQLEGKLEETKESTKKRNKIEIGENGYPKDWN